eukprot:scpid23617/ scgid7702/ Retrovirus-related Pol polyprotein from transposon 412; Protease; Reverse transcriptase; Endonuclease
MSGAVVETVAYMDRSSQRNFTAPVKSTPVYVDLAPPHRLSEACGYCGQLHPAGKALLSHSQATCSQCKKQGHYASVCRGRQRGQGPSASFGTQAASDSRVCGWMDQGDGFLEAYSIHDGTNGFLLPLRVLVLNHQHILQMRVDTGSMVTILPRSQVPAGVTLQPSQLARQPIRSTRVKPIGMFNGRLSNHGREVTETIYVVDDSERHIPALIGERASLALGLLMIPETGYADAAPIEESDSLPPMKTPVNVHTKKDAEPAQQTSRRVPPALMPSLRAQIDVWVQQGVVEPVHQVDEDDFVSPLVAVPKPDRTYRWCVDLRQVNKSIDRPGLQLPTTDELLGQLANASYFSKIDLKTGYSQLELKPESRRYFVIASPLGYFRFKRLPFGVSSGPELFQRQMEQILAGCEGVVIYLDDIDLCCHPGRARSPARSSEGCSCSTQRHHQRQEVCVQRIVSTILGSCRLR